MTTISHVLLALAVIVAAGRLMSAVVARVGQPPVIGEVIAGILLGPSLLGRVLPDSRAVLFPSEVTSFLGLIAQLGIVLYLFLVGIHFDVGVLRTRTRVPIAISYSSIAVPFALGATSAVALHAGFAPRGVTLFVFSLFLGVSMAITAFPVLARILDDRGMRGTRLGAIALACAAVDDVSAWCLLAVLVSTVRGELASVAGMLLTIAGYFAAMLVVVRPGVQRLVSWHDARPRPAQTTLGIALLVLLLSALCAEQIGIHALFGAFLIGALIPHDSILARKLAAQLEDLVVVLLLPVFFAITGLRTQIGLLSGLDEWLICGALIAIASIGKFGGSAIAARLSGLSWRDSTAVGVLMNTRGLVELVVLNVGLELGVVSPLMFAMLVIMALVTTVATTPLLGALRIPCQPATRSRDVPARSGPDDPCPVGARLVTGSPDDPSLVA